METVVVDARDNDYFQHAYQTLKEMMHDRGLVLDGQHPDTFQNFYNNKLVLLTAPSCLRAGVFWFGGKLSKDNFKEASSIIQEHSIKTAVFVMRTKPTSQASKEMAMATGVRVQVFQLTQLYRNITKHHTLPIRYKRLSLDESTRAMKVYRCTSDKLHVLLYTDAIVEYYAWEVGDIIEVTMRGGAVKLKKVVATGTA